MLSQPVTPDVTATDFKWGFKSRSSSVDGAGMHRFLVAAKTTALAEAAPLLGANLVTYGSTPKYRRSRLPKSAKHLPPTITEEE